MPDNIPRQLEVLLKKASLDAAFKAALLEKRSKLADEIQLPLDPSERAMLDNAPKEHLALIIGKTVVPPPEQEILKSSSFSGAGTAAIAGVSVMALLAYLTAASSSISTIFGSITTTLGHVATSIATEKPKESYRENLLKTAMFEVQGKPFQAAITDIQQAIGVKITVKSEDPGTDFSFPTTVPIKGETFSNALTMLCREVTARTRLRFRLEFFPTEVQIYFSR